MTDCTGHWTHHTDLPEGGVALRCSGCTSWLIIRENGRGDTVDDAKTVQEAVRKAWSPR